jgi:hypothetical protein
MLLSSDDGLIEVVGLTTYQLPLLQAGGYFHPKKICPIKEAFTFPMSSEMAPVFSNHARGCLIISSPCFFTCRWSHSSKECP